MENLKDKVAFVTGGASGIGLGISKAMVAAGMRVVIADVREDHLKDARAWFVSQHLSRRVKCLKLDVTNRKAYTRIADQAEKKFAITRARPLPKETSSMSLPRSQITWTSA